MKTKGGNSAIPISDSVRGTNYLEDEDLEEIIVQTLEETYREAARTAPDTFGADCLFLEFFLTPEMADDFPMIARDFLVHEIGILANNRKVDYLAGVNGNGSSTQKLEQYTLNLMMNSLRNGSFRMSQRRRRWCSRCTGGLRKRAVPENGCFPEWGELAEKVTRELSEMADPEPGALVDVATGKPVERTIWDYLMVRIGNAYGVSGLMGNLYAESGLRPNNLQNSFEKKLGITDAEYTKCVDEGAYADFATDRAGYGLAQWTYFSRKKALWELAKKRGVSIADLAMQMDFLSKELVEQYPGVTAALISASSVREASDAVLMGYEKPADQSEKVRKMRAEYGERFYNRYQGKADENGQNLEGQDGASEAVPFLVRVTTQHLNIRTGPGTSFGRVRFIPPGVYTIVEVREGTGSKAGWGRLKSREGWISLEFCRRL